MSFESKARWVAAAALAGLVGATALSGGKDKKGKVDAAKGGDRTAEEPDVPAKKGPEGAKGSGRTMSAEPAGDKIQQPRIKNGIDQINKDIAVNAALIESWEAELSRIRVAKPGSSDPINRGTAREEDLRILIEGARRQIAENVEAKRRLEDAGHRATEPEKGTAADPTDTRGGSTTEPDGPKPDRPIVFEPEMPRKGIVVAPKGPAGRDTQPRAGEPAPRGPHAGPRDEPREPRAVEPPEDLPRREREIVPPPPRSVRPPEESRRPDRIPPKEIPSRVLTPEEQRAFDDAFSKRGTLTPAERKAFDDVFDRNKK